MQKKKLIYKNGRYYINDEKDIVGISAQTFATLLKDREIFTDDTLKIVEYFYLEEDHQATTKYIVEKYNLSQGMNFNSKICKVVRSIYKKLGDDVVVSQHNQDKPSYWCILFHGWHEGVNNHFVWKLREEVVTAIEELGLFGEKTKNETANSGSETFIYKEGRLVEEYTVKYERSAKIRDAFLKYFIRKNGNVFCEACGFDFEKVYGALGAGFIEVHHNKPVSSFEDEHTVDIHKDLNCLCANCHRMIHHINGEIISVKQLKKLLIKRSEQREAKPSGFNE